MFTSDSSQAAQQFSCSESQYEHSSQTHPSSDVHSPAEKREVEWPISSSKGMLHVHVHSICILQYNNIYVLIYARHA